MSPHHAQSMHLKSVGLVQSTNRDANPIADTGLVSIWSNSVEEDKAGTHRDDNENQKKKES